MKTKEEILEEVDNSVISSVESADYYNGVTYCAEYVIDNYLEPLQKENEALKASVYALLNGSEQCKLQAQNKKLMEFVRAYKDSLSTKTEVDLDALRYEQSVFIDKAEQILKDITNE